MAIELSTLTARLAALISDLTEDQYKSIVIQAVTAFNLRTAQQKRGSLSVVNGTATYTLPADFLAWSYWEPLDMVDNTVISGQGLIPLNQASLNERVQVLGNQLTIYPTPRYTMTRYYWYRGGHSLSEGAYPYMTDWEAELVLIKAQANALRAAMSGKAGEGWSYKFGDVTINKGTLARSMREAAEALDREFDRQTSGLGFAPGGLTEYTQADINAYLNS